MKEVESTKWSKVNLDCWGPKTIKNENEMLKKYEAIDIEFPKGAISLMHGNLIHGSHANLSKNKTRNQYSMCYMNRGVDFFVGKSSPRIRAKLY